MKSLFHKKETEIPILLYPSDIHNTNPSSDIFLPKVLKKYGAFYLLNAPLPDTPFPIAFDIFQQSLEDKQKLKATDKSSVRGYNNDFKVGREWWDYSPEIGEEPPNVSGNAHAATKDFFEKGIQVLNEIVVALRKESEKGKCDGIPENPAENGMSTLRYLRYSTSLLDPPPPPPPQPPASTANTTEQPNDGAGGILSRMQPHTDHGILTLMDADKDGLYIYGPDMHVYAAPPLNNAVLIIAADCLTWWTSRGKKKGGTGILPTPHEVVVPDANDNNDQSHNQDRISVAIFLRPKPETVLGDAADLAVMEGRKADESEKGAMTFKRWAGEKSRSDRRCWMLGRRLDGEKSGIKKLFSRS